MRKRIIVILTCGLFGLFGLYGCGTEGADGSTIPGSSEFPVVTEALTVTETPTEAPTVTPTPELTIADISSMELVSQMKIGWNLGNSLDATGGGIGVMTETSWGNPKTKQEMIDAIVEAGFNVVRIPVTWDSHFGPAPEYKVHDVWLQRVKEVVDYAYSKGVYVIIDKLMQERIMLKPMYQKELTIMQQAK